MPASQPVGRVDMEVGASDPLAGTSPVTRIALLLVVVVIMAAAILLILHHVFTA